MNVLGGAYSCYLGVSGRQGGNKRWEKGLGRLVDCLFRLRVYLFTFLFLGGRREENASSGRPQQHCGPQARYMYMYMSDPVSRMSRGKSV
jgi:hypothetical protein